MMNKEMNDGELDRLPSHAGLCRGGAPETAVAVVALAGGSRSSGRAAIGIDGGSHLAGR